MVVFSTFILLFNTFSFLWSVSASMALLAILVLLAFFCSYGVVGSLVIFDLNYGLDLGSYQNPKYGLGVGLNFNLTTGFGLVST